MEQNKNNKIVELDIDSIKPDLNQPRKEFDEELLKEFGDSYKSIGIINPIEIDSNNIIITGENRWRAAKLADIQKVPCIVIRDLSPEDRLTRQLAENIARKSLTILEQKEAIKKLLSLSSSQKSPSTGGRPKEEDSYHGIARKIGCSATWIKQILDLDKAPEIIQEAIKNKEMAVKVATEIQKLPTIEQQEEYTKNYIEIKKAGLRKDSNRVAEEIARIRKGEKTERMEIKKTIDDEIMNLITSFKQCGDRAKYFEKHINKLTDFQNEKLQRYIMISMKTKIMPFLANLYKQKGKFIFEIENE